MKFRANDSIFYSPNFPGVQSKKEKSFFGSYKAIYQMFLFWVNLLFCPGWLPACWSWGNAIGWPDGYSDSASLSPAGTSWGPRWLNARAAVSARTLASPPISQCFLIPGLAPEQSRAAQAWVSEEVFRRAKKTLVTNWNKPLNAGWNYREPRDGVKAFFGLP